MKKTIAMIALTAVLLSAAACSSGESTTTTTTAPAATTTQATTAAPEANKTFTSNDYTNILLSVREADDPNSITGRDENGELVRTHDAAPYEMTEEDKTYFAFEGVLKHLEKVGSFTIDLEERWAIEDDAIKGLTDKTDAELAEIRNNAVLEHYSKKANVTLTDDEIAKIGEEAIAAEEVMIKESMKEQMRMELEVAGLTPELLDEFAYSTSLMMTRAYGLGIFMPADGQTDAVKEACLGFVELQKQSFETYLVDQYEIAKQAVVEVLDSGEVVLVMCENADDVFAQIKAEIEG